MKKFNFLKFSAVVLLSGVIVFSACKKDEDDTEKPVITLTGGDQTVAFSLTEAFTDPGFAANDNEDGDLKGSVVVSGSVNRKSAGEYTLKYNVTDKAGNAADEKTRKVLVDAGLYIANTTGVRYKAEGWYNATTSADSYTDTLVIVSANKVRFTRLANWSNATVEFSVSGVTITATDQLKSVGNFPQNLNFKCTQAAMITSGSANIFEFKGSVTTTTGTIETDNFYYVYSKL